MYLALRGSSIIHPGTMYDAGPFLTTGDIIPPCKVQHRAKLLFDPKQTVGDAIKLDHFDGKIIIYIELCM